MELKPIEKRGLIVTLLAMGAVLGLFLAMIFIPGWPLHGQGQQTLATGQVLFSGPPGSSKRERPGFGSSSRPARAWSHVIVPMMLLIFLIPGMAYGMVVGTSVRRPGMPAVSA